MKKKRIRELATASYIFFYEKRILEKKVICSYQSTFCMLAYELYPLTKPQRYALATKAANVKL
jgi:hypothetical protein